MSKSIPSIKKYMTPSPHTIGTDQALSRAHHVMREFGIRHWPVLHGGRLAGMITQRDLALVESLADVDAELIRVEDAMSPEVYSVSPDAPLDEVISEMATHKYGSAVVQQDGKVVGIVTLVDVCNAFVRLLHGQLAR